MMNDFTKEELISILSGLTDSGYPDHAWCNAIYDKIENMIANYCDHTWSKGTGHVLCCIKCHMMDPFATAYPTL
jgi:hypothetical protein